MKELDFYKELRQKIDNWAEGKGKSNKFLNYILLAPDLFYLIVKLVMDNRIPVAGKALLGALIAYFISPVDIIPEMFVGPAGYIDDIVLVALTLTNLLESVDEKILLEHWPSDKNLLELIKKLIKIAPYLRGSGSLKKLKKFN